MNFFQAQDSARRKTWQLGLMFTAAVVTLIILTNLLLLFAVGWTGQQGGFTFAESVANIPADSWLWVSAGVVGVVATASLYKYLSLQGGGRNIAEALGGKLIHQNTRDAKQRRLLNIVEEMAIAAGTPVPPVYLIPESSINAFAAGFGVDDAVVGINQGTLALLNRDELQGVVAHEFSHILNGDTNINLRLIAILHGILFLGMIGYGLMRSAGFSRKNGVPVVVIGIGLLIIGYGGTFFGNLIKAAVSRQREFLADASAVQFTRNPSGIADALKKIGGFSSHSYLHNEAAEQASHMFFGAAAKKFAGNLMATHPPLDKRIRAIEPNWDGQYPVLFHQQTNQAINQQVNPQDREVPHATPMAGVAGFAGTGSGEDVATWVVDQVGTPNSTSLAAASALIEDTATNLQAAAHDPYEARALIYAMLLDAEPGFARQQMSYIQQHAEAGVPQHVVRLAGPVSSTDALHRLTLLEMAMPALKELSYPQYKRFAENTARLITADERVSLFEWVLHRVLMKELYPHFEGGRRSHGNIRKINKVADEAAKLLAILASQSHPGVNEQLAAYNAGMRELGLKRPFAKQDTFDYQRLNDALAKLRKLHPLVKPGLIKACVTTVLADRAMNPSEAALLHGIAATLDCPLPAHVNVLAASSADSI